MGIKKIVRIFFLLEERNHSSLRFIYFTTTFSNNERKDQEWRKTEFPVSRWLSFRSYFRLSSTNGNPRLETAIEFSASPVPRYLDFHGLLYDNIFPSPPRLQFVADKNSLVNRRESILDCLLSSSLLSDYFTLDFIEY